MATLAAKLLALHQLHKRGLLTDDEFARAKSREIAAADQATVRPARQPVPAPPPPGTPVPAKTLNPVVPAIALSLGAAGAASGLGG